MKAIAVVPETPKIELIDVPEPKIQAPDEIKLRVLRVGICGTDREEASGGRAKAPQGEDRLVIGHEMFGQVEETGKEVTRVKPGDFAVFTVRRGCGHCTPCNMNRSDFCESGDYVERGIWGMNGYQTETVVDKEQYIVHVPSELEPVGVLCEPLSVAEKAIDEAVRLQLERLPDASVTPDWLYGRHVLVAGLGPVGLLGAMALRLRGADVYGLDIVDPGSARPQWLEKIGGHYLDGRQVKPDQVDNQIGGVDLIFEATGVASLEFNLLDALSLNGIYVLTGIPGGDRPISLDGAELIRRLVLQNQVLVGSVNAARGHFQMAVDELLAAHLRWGDHIQKLITNCYDKNQYDQALHQHPADEIKAVIEWGKAQ